MVVEIHEKLGAKLHTDTFSYVKTCARTRPCKSIHLCRGTSFYSEDVSQSLALVKPMFSAMVSYIKSCTLRRICKLKSCGCRFFQAHQWEDTYRHVLVCEN